MGFAEIIQPFVCAGSAACTASACIHPMDLAKVRLQLLTTEVKPGAISMLNTMVKTDGFTSIYAGLSASLMRQAIYGSARIGLHRTFSAEISKRNGGKPPTFFEKVLSGMASGSIAVCIGTPFDVSLVRMQSDAMKPTAERRGYKNVIDACVRITKEEGFLRLYSGLIPNILRGMSMNVGMMACYDQAVEMIATYVTKDDIKNPTMPTKMMGSCVAGVTAAVFSLPFDLMKSRLQDGVKYSGVVDVFTQTLKKEGPLAFWTGFGAYYGRCAPHAMIVLLLSDILTTKYKKAFLSAKN